jgi:hypothetical protein
MEQVEAAGEDLVTELSAEHCFLGHSLTALCNVGISIFPENGTDCEALMKRADMAKSRAREDSGSRFSVFTEELDRELVKRLGWKAGYGRRWRGTNFFLSTSHKWTCAREPLQVSRHFCAGIIANWA